MCATFAEVRCCSLGTGKTLIPFHRLVLNEIKIDRQSINEIGALFPGFHHEKNSCTLCRRSWSFGMPDVVVGKF